MTSSNAIAIVAIVINIVMPIACRLIDWLKTRKASHATLPVAKPVSKPKRKRKLTPQERRLIRNFRMLQVLFVVEVVWVIADFYFPLLPLKPDRVSIALSVGVIITAVIAIISFELDTIRQIKTGEFMKRMKRIAREQNRKNVQH